MHFHPGSLCKVSKLKYGQIRNFKNTTMVEQVACLVAQLLSFEPPHSQEILQKGLAEC
jgi:hypothetical protein